VEAKLSKAQVDRLGERLRRGAISEDDLRLLDTYRLWFSPPYEAVIAVLRAEGLTPTGRPAKSTTSIADKLRRESMRLTQRQDIAGARVVVPDLASQDEVVERLAARFPQVTTFDRRKKPSHGYRAVHLVVMQDGRGIEVQIRTSLQHLWAELSEKVSDVIDPKLKYGGGPRMVTTILREASRLMTDAEKAERTTREARSRYEATVISRVEAPKVRKARTQMKRLLRKMEQDVVDIRAELTSLLEGYDKDDRATEERLACCT